MDTNHDSIAAHLPPYRPVPYHPPRRLQAEHRAGRCSVSAYSPWCCCRRTPHRRATHMAHAAVAVKPSQADRQPSGTRSGYATRGERNAPACTGCQPRRRMPTPPHSLTGIPYASPTRVATASGPCSRHSPGVIATDGTRRHQRRRPSVHRHPSLLPYHALQVASRARRPGRKLLEDGGIDGARGCASPH